MRVVKVDLLPGRPRRVLSYALREATAAVSAVSLFYVFSVRGKASAAVSLPALGPALVPIAPL